MLVPLDWREWPGRDLAYHDTTPGALIWVCRLSITLRRRPITSRAGSMPEPLTSLISRTTSQMQCVGSQRHPYQFHFLLYLALCWAPEILMSPEILDGTEFTGFRVTGKEPAFSPIFQAAWSCPGSSPTIYYQTHEDCKAHVISSGIESSH